MSLAQFALVALVLACVFLFAVPFILLWSDKGDCNG